MADPTQPKTEAEKALAQEVARLEKEIAQGKAQLERIAAQVAVKQTQLDALKGAAQNK